MRVYERGDFFGERALVLDEPRAATVESVGDVRCMRLGVDIFRMLMERHGEHASPAVCYPALPPHAQPPPRRAAPPPQRQHAASGASFQRLFACCDGWRGERSHPLGCSLASQGWASR